MPAAIRNKLQAAVVQQAHWARLTIQHIREGEAAPVAQVAVDATPVIYVGNPSWKLREPTQRRIAARHVHRRHVFLAGHVIY